MKITVPPTRIKLFTENPDHACSLKNNTNSHNYENIQGGEIKKSKQKYVLMEINGKKVKETQIYESSRPANAALKAYYAYSRTTKPLWKKMEIPKTSEYYHILKDELFAPPATITIRKADSMKTMSYNAYYVPNTHPNKHELEKGIFKKSVITKVMLKK